MVYYSPHLTFTVIGENCIMGESKHDRGQFKSQVIHKHLHNLNFTLVCEHHCTRHNIIIINGVLIDYQCFTHPLMIMNFKGDHLMATSENPMDIAWANGTHTANCIQAQSQVIASYICQYFCNIKTNAHYT